MGLATAQVPLGLEGGAVSLESLAAALETCRTRAHPATSFVLSGFGSGRADLPATIDLAQASFMPDPLPAALARTLPNQYALFGEVRQVALQSSLATLIDRLAAAQCPVEVRGYASVEGSFQQNEQLANARRDWLVQRLTDAGLHPASLTLGPGTESDTFPDLPANRRVEVRLRPDLAWHCQRLTDARALFPAYGLWRVAAAARPTDREIASGRQLLQALAPAHDTYPCQTRLHVRFNPAQTPQSEAKALGAALQAGRSPPLPVRLVPADVPKPSVFIGIPSAAER